MEQTRLERIQELQVEKAKCSLKGVPKEEIELRRELKSKAQKINRELKKLKSEDSTLEVMNNLITKKVDPEVITEEIPETAEPGILDKLLSSIMGSSLPDAASLDAKIKLNPELAKVKPINVPDVSKMTERQVKGRHDAIDSLEKQMMALSMGAMLKQLTVGMTKYVTGIDIEDEIKDNTAYTRALGKIIPYESLVDDKYSLPLFGALHGSAMMSAFFKAEQKIEAEKKNNINKQE